MRKTSDLALGDLERELDSLGSKLSLTYGTAPNVILDICVEMELWLNRLQEIDSDWAIQGRKQVLTILDLALNGKISTDIYDQIMRLMIQASEKIEECRSKNLKAPDSRSWAGLVSSDEGELAHATN